MHKQLSVEEREEIQDGLWAKESIRSIAKRLGRSHSSIVREINKNVPLEQRRYTPRLANERALLKRKSRGRTDRLKDETIRRYGIDHLKQRWSPEQIAGRMKLEGIGSISHEAIYQFIYAQIHRGGNGPENSDWQTMEEVTGLSCFFAHPYRSCERGSNENANGLLRDYYPKGTDFREVSDEELAQVEYALNSRPRKRHDWRTPLEIWSGALAC